MNKTMPPAPVAAGPVILVVDDDPTIRQMFARALGTLAAIELASNGAEALKMLAAKRYDCLLMDLHMPGIDGMQVLRTLAEKPGPNSGIPKLIATADASAQARAQALSLAAMSFLPKPVSIAILVSLVRAALKQSAAARAAEEERAKKKA
jgi:CheY-like chemotaxis protein